MWYPGRAMSSSGPLPKLPAPRARPAGRVRRRRAEPTRRLWPPQLVSPLAYLFHAARGAALSIYLFASASGLTLAGCDEPATNLRSAVELLAAERGEVAERAYQRIEPHGRAALPYLEAALHRVAAPGRRNIVIALRRLALPESTALLGHLAAFDADPQVRAESYRTLEVWAAAPPGPRSPAAGARAALHKIDELRGEP